MEVMTNKGGTTLSKGAESTLCCDMKKMDFDNQRHCKLFCVNV